MISLLKTNDLENIVNQLKNRLEEPSEEIPSTQIFTYKNLRSLLLECYKNTNIKKKLTGKELLDHLIKSGLAKKLDIHLKNNNKAIYYVGLGNVKNIDHLEILQASDPHGVICYFSAISYHQLTTQITPHNHIATLNNIPKLNAQNHQNYASSKIPKLGTLLFYYAGIPYYSTKRDKDLVPGIQSVYFSEKTIIKITNLEQTLLDTLHRPWSCGGPSVVFEAWKKGLDNLNESRLTKHLTLINKSLYIRRVGCMLDLNQYSVKNPQLLEILKNAMQKTENSINRLLPAVPSKVLDKKWNLELPE